MGGNVKSYIFVTLTLGFVSDLYPSMVLITSPLGLTMPEKKWETDIQTHRQTDRQTDKTNHSMVAHFVRGNYNKLDRLECCLSDKRKPQLLGKCACCKDSQFENYDKVEHFTTFS